MEHCFLGLLFIMPNKVVPTFESVDEKSKRVTSQLKLSLLSSGAVHCVVQGCSNLVICPKYSYNVRV